MNIKVEKQTTATAIKVKLERHREVSRQSARKRYKQIRTAKWSEALEYLLTLEGDIQDIAPVMADKYNISKLHY